MEAPPSDAPATGDAPISERPALGGRDVDERGVNSGLLRCPRCLSRLVSCRGRLRERQGPDASFWVPHRPAETASGEPASEGTGAPAEAGDVPEEEAWEWTEHQHAWWWEMADMEEVDNGGLSRLVTSPAGPLKLIMCCECNYGPFGYQRESEPRLWLCCELLHQQDARLGAPPREPTPPPATHRPSSPATRTLPQRRVSHAPSPGSSTRPRLPTQPATRRTFACRMAST